MIEAAGRCLGFETKQKEATVEFVILLPTSYGKSVYYATIPFIFDQLRGNIGSVVVVVSPLLIALVKMECFKVQRISFVSPVAVKRERTLHLN